MLDTTAVTVLVVDDTEAQRYAVSHDLRSAGFKVLTAANGEEALAQAANVPDVILTDISMPGMSGFDLARRLRENPATASIPIVFYTAASYGEANQDEAARLGMVGLLIAPVEVQHLIGSINVALLRAGSKKATDRRGRVRV